VDIVTFTLSPDDIKRCRSISMRYKDRIKEIATAVSAETSIPTSAIYGPGRTADVVNARQLVMYLARQDGMSFPAIGKAMNRDHTTAIAAVRREAARRAKEAPE
jgi:chromosomal replication initiation ATPase DnaA